MTSESVHVISSRQLFAWTTASKSVHVSPGSFSFAWSDPQRTPQKRAEPDVLHAKITSWREEILCVFPQKHHTDDEKSGKSDIGLQTCVHELADRSYKKLETT